MTLSWRDASCAETLPLFNGASDWKFFMNSIVSWGRQENKIKHQPSSLATKKSLQTVLLDTQSLTWALWHCSAIHVQVIDMPKFFWKQKMHHFMCHEDRNKTKQEVKLHNIKMLILLLQFASDVSVFLSAGVYEWESPLPQQWSYRTSFVSRDWKP